MLHVVPWLTLPWLDPVLCLWHPSWLRAGELRAGGAVNPLSLPCGVTAVSRG